MQPERAPSADHTENWVRLVGALQADARLGGSVIGSGILAALALGLSADSRGFANTFEVAHALVLREIGVLADELGLVAVTREDARTQRRFLVLTDDGTRVTERAAVAAGF